MVLKIWQSDVNESVLCPWAPLFPPSRVTGLTKMTVCCFRYKRLQTLHSGLNSMPPTAHDAPLQL